jgi:hypothetical protein
MVKVILEGSLQDVLDSIPDEAGKEEAIRAFDSFLGYNPQEKVQLAKDSETLPYKKPKKRHF